MPRHSRGSLQTLRADILARLYEARIWAFFKNVAVFINWSRAIYVKIRLLGKLSHKTSPQDVSPPKPDPHIP